MQVTRHNFPLVLSDFKKELSNCDFVALDQEMFGIQKAGKDVFRSQTPVEAWQTPYFAAKTYVAFQCGICLCKIKRDSSSSNGGNNTSNSNNNGNDNNNNNSNDGTSATTSPLTSPSGAHNNSNNNINTNNFVDPNNNNNNTSSANQQSGAAESSAQNNNNAGSNSASPSSSSAGPINMANATNKLEIRPYNFWLRQHGRTAQDVAFNMETIDFLVKSGMDFNTWARDGMEYCNTSAAEALRSKLLPTSYPSGSREVAKQFCSYMRDIVEQWYFSCGNSANVTSSANSSNNNNNNNNGRILDLISAPFVYDGSSTHSGKNSQRNSSPASRTNNKKNYNDSNRKNQNSKTASNTNLDESDEKSKNSVKRGNKKQKQLEWKQKNQPQQPPVPPPPAEVSPDTPKSDEAAGVNGNTLLLQEARQESSNSANGDAIGNRLAHFTRRILMTPSGKATASSSKRRESIMMANENTNNNNSTNIYPNGLNNFQVGNNGGNVNANDVGGIINSIHYDVVAASPDGTLVAGGDSLGNVSIWTYFNLRCVIPELAIPKQITRQNSGVTALCFHPNGSFLAVGYANSLVILFDITTAIFVANNNSNNNNNKTVYDSFSSSVSHNFVIHSFWLSKMFHRRGKASSSSSSSGQSSSGGTASSGSSRSSRSRNSSSINTNNSNSSSQQRSSSQDSNNDDPRPSPSNSIPSTNKVASFLFDARGITLTVVSAGLDDTGDEMMMSVYDLLRGSYVAPPLPKAASAHDRSTLFAASSLDKNDETLNADDKKFSSGSTIVVSSASPLPFLLQSPVDPNHTLLCHPDSHRVRCFDSMSLEEISSNNNVNNNNNVLHSLCDSNTATPTSPGPACFTSIRNEDHHHHHELFSLIPYHQRATLQPSCIGVAPNGKFAAGVVSCQLLHQQQQLQQQNSGAAASAQNDNNTENITTAANGGNATCGSSNIISKLIVAVWEVNKELAFSVKENSPLQRPESPSTVKGGASKSQNNINNNNTASMSSPQSTASSNFPSTSSITGNSNNNNSSSCRNSTIFLEVPLPQFASSTSASFMATAIPTSATASGATSTALPPTTNAPQSAQQEPNTTEIKSESGSSKNHLKCKLVFSPDGLQLAVAVSFSPSAVFASSPANNNNNNNNLNVAPPANTTSIFVYDLSNMLTTGVGVLIGILAADPSDCISSSWFANNNYNFNNSNNNNSNDEQLGTMNNNKFSKRVATSVSMALLRAQLSQQQQQQQQQNSEAPVFAPFHFNFFKNKNGSYNIVSTSNTFCLLPPSQQQQLASIKENNNTISVWEPQFQNSGDSPISFNGGVVSVSEDSVSILICEHPTPGFELPIMLNTDLFLYASGRKLSSQNNNGNGNGYSPSPVVWEVEFEKKNATSNIFTYRRKPPGYREQLIRRREDELTERLGFRIFFEALKDSKKPLVGHHFVSDLAFFLNQHEFPLREDFSWFKKTIHSIFPTVYDTKAIVTRYGNDNNINDEMGLQELYSRRQQIAINSQNSFLNSNNNNNNFNQRVSQYSYQSLHSSSSPSSLSSLFGRPSSKFVVDVQLPMPFLSYHPSIGSSSAVAHQGAYDALMTAVVFYSYALEHPLMLTEMENSVAFYGINYWMNLGSTYDFLSWCQVVVVEHPSEIFQNLDHVLEFLSIVCPGVVDAVPGASVQFTKTCSGFNVVVRPHAQGNAIRVMCDELTRRGGFRTTVASGKVSSVSVGAAQQKAGGGGGGALILISGNKDDNVSSGAANANSTGAAASGTNNVSSNNSKGQGVVEQKKTKKQKKTQKQQQQLLQAQKSSINNNNGDDDHVEAEDEETSDEEDENESSKNSPVTGSSSTNKKSDDEGSSLASSKKKGSSSSSKNSPNNHDNNNNSQHDPNSLTQSNKRNSTTSAEVLLVANNNMGSEADLIIANSRSAPKALSSPDIGDAVAEMIKKSKEAKSTDRMVTSDSINTAAMVTTDQQQQPQQQQQQQHLI